MDNIQSIVSKQLRLIATNQRVVAEGWLLLRLEALFCSIHLQLEGLISILEPYSTVEKCAVIIFDNEKIQK